MHLARFLAVLCLPLAGCLMAQPAFAGQTSVYTPIASCRTLDEGIDSFLLECRGPGGLRGGLQYFDGRVVVSYLPVMADKQSVDTDVMVISNTPGKVFSGKLEWRINDGERSPCAAIVRLPLEAGSRLLVTDLRRGRHLGQARSNEAAHALAAKACAGAGGSKASLDAPPVDTASARPATHWKDDIFGPAEPQIRSDLDRQMVACQDGAGAPQSCTLLSVLVRSHLFYGDFSGDGRDDVVGFFETIDEGSCFTGSYHVAAWRQEGAGFVFAGKDHYLYPDLNKDLMFSNGKVAYTAKTLSATDARCFPSKDMPMQINVTASGVTWSEAS